MRRKQVENGWLEVENTWDSAENRWNEVENERVRMVGKNDVAAHNRSPRHQCPVGWWVSVKQVAHKIAKSTYLLTTTDGCIPFVVVIEVVESTETS